MELRTMTTPEYDRWRRHLAAEYAVEQVAAGTWSPEEAESLAAAGLDEHLPDGPATAGHLLLVAADEHGPVGVLWLALTHPRGAPDTGWIYDIEVVPERRGQGLGRALLAAAEREIVSRGVNALGLNVFGSNEAALGLYRSAGYDVVTQQMRKQLT